jgi:preprotein translocase subunit YajC
MYLAHSIFLFLAQATESAPDQSKALISNLLIIPIMLLFLYFFVIRPQRKEEKRKKDMIAELAKGDTVLTNSGMYGKFVEFKDNNESVILSLSSNTNVKFSTSAIVKKIPTSE